MSEGDSTRRHTLLEQRTRGERERALSLLPIVSLDSGLEMKRSGRLLFTRVSEERSSRDAGRWRPVASHLFPS